jgi:hypothetical protein
VRNMCPMLEYKNEEHVPNIGDHVSKVWEHVPNIGDQCVQSLGTCAQCEQHVAQVGEHVSHVTPKGEDHVPNLENISPVRGT